MGLRREATILVFYFTFICFICYLKRKKLLGVATVSSCPRQAQFMAVRFRNQRKPRI